MPIKSQKESRYFENVMAYKILIYLFTFDENLMNLRILIFSSDTFSVCSTLSKTGFE